jgi:hypothetical protein
MNTEVHYVYADSINRSPTESGSHYTLQLTKKLRNIEKVELLSVSVPHVQYNITQGSNIITINSTNYSIPPGFYRAQDLAIVLSNTFPLTVTYIGSQGIFIINHNNTPFTISFNTSEIQKRMGFGPGTYSSTDHASTPFGAFIKSGQMVYSENIIDLSTTKFVFLDIEELRHDALVDSKVNTTLDGNFDGTTISRTFGAIPMDVIQDWACTKVFKRDYEYYIKYDIPLPQLTRLTIRWLDYNGQILDFNGMERNCFLLRVFCRPSAPPPEKKEFDEDELVKKLQRMIDDAFPPPPPKNDKGLKRWFLILPFLAVMSFILFRVLRR